MIDILRHFFQKSHAAPSAPPEPKPVNAELLATVADDLRQAQTSLNRISGLSASGFVDKTLTNHRLRLALVTLEILSGKEPA